MKSFQLIRNSLKDFIVSQRLYLILATVVIVGVIIGVALDLSKADWAAWVQAVGSVTAIWVAIWVTSQESRRRKADSLAIARLAAAGLTMRLATTVSTVRQIKERFQIWGKSDFDPGTLEQNIVILETSGLVTIDNFLLLIPLRGNAAYKLAGAFDRLNAAIFALKTFSNSDRMRESLARKEFIERMGFLLGETCNLFDLAVVALQNESLSLTSPFYDGSDPSIHHRSK